MYVNKAINIELNLNQLVNAIKRMKKEEQESFIEDLLALTNTEYLKSIKESRADYKAGRVKTYSEVFGKTK